MPRDPRAYLWDALHAAESISRFVEHKFYDDYDHDELLAAAVERKFEIIGESLAQLARIDAELAARVPDLRQIIGFRNILIHGYARVDNAQVWQSVGDLPGLRIALQGLLDELSPDGR